MRSANKLFGGIGCDGKLTLHVPQTKFPIHYLVGAQTLVFLTKMRNEYLRGNTTTWSNTDTGIKPLTFYEQDLQQRIDIHELGGEEELNDFINHLANAEEVKHEKGTKEAIMERKSLIQKQSSNSNSINKTGTAGSLADRMTKLSIYGKAKKSETDQKIDKIKKL